MKTMNIEVNGRKVDWVENETVSQLLKRMRYIFPLIIVKINDKVIPKSDYSNVIIPKAAKVDIVHMISGG